MSNLPPGTTQRDIDKHVDGETCDECEKIFPLSELYEDSGMIFCKRCLANAEHDEL